MELFILETELLVPETELLVPETDRWARLKAFVAEWHTPLTEADGIPEAELVAAETRLDITLPTALKEWYRLAGRRTNITRQQNFLLLPDELKLVTDESSRHWLGDFLDGSQRDERILVFHTENQDVMQWGIRETHWDRMDPPVVLDEIGWEVENGLLSQFALQMVILETMATSPHLNVAFTDREGIRACEELFGDIGLPDWHFIVHGTCTVRFRGSAEVLIMVSSCPQPSNYCHIELTARTAETCSHALSLLPAIDWGRAWDSAE